MEYALAYCLDHLAGLPLDPYRACIDLLRPGSHERGDRASRAVLVVVFGGRRRDRASGRPLTGASPAGAGLGSEGTWSPGLCRRPALGAGWLGLGLRGPLARALLALQVKTSPVRAESETAR